MVHVTLDTDLGSIVLRVFTERAPATSQAFLTHVYAGSFAGNGGFYRVVRAEENDRGTPVIDVVQGGVLGEPRASTGIAHETTSQTGLRHTDGTVSLARSAVGTATGGAFFICVGAQPALDEGGLRNSDGQGYASFARVIEGMHVVRKIHRLQTSAHDANPYRRGQMLETPVLIRKAWRNEREI